MNKALAALAALAVLTLTGCGGAAQAQSAHPASAKPAANIVRFAVTGTGSASVNGAGLFTEVLNTAGRELDPVADTSVVLPWSKSEHVPAFAHRFRLEAVGNAGVTSLTCTITARGVVVDRETSTDTLDSGDVIVKCDSGP